MSLHFIDIFVEFLTLDSIET